MLWKPAKFKGKSVWVAVGTDGALEGSKVPMRYSKSPGAKVYTANAANLELGDGEAFELSAEPSPPGKSGGTTGRKRGSGFGKAGTRTATQSKLAKAAARELISNLSAETIVCYTDGACKGNPGPAGSGAYVVFPDGRRFELAQSLGRATNNIGELTAIKMTLELLDTESVPADAPVALLTDSDYSSGVLVRGWKAKKNTELILGIRDQLAARPGVTIHWIAGHVGLDGNERADTLANAGVIGRTFQRPVE